MSRWQPHLDHFPTLRARGLFRTECTGTTPRDHHGLSRPDSQYANLAHPKESS